MCRSALYYTYTNLKERPDDDAVMSAGLGVENFNYPAYRTEGNVLRFVPITLSNIKSFRSPGQLSNGLEEGDIVQVPRA